MIAFATIVSILAGAFSIGQRRLQQLRSAAPSPASPPLAVAPLASPVNHPTAGLQAPAPLPLASVQSPAADRFPDPKLAPDPDGSTNVSTPPDGALPPAPPVDAGAAPRRMTLSDYVGFTQFTKMRDAYLGRPDPQVNPERVQHPEAMSGLTVAHAESRMVPRTMGQVLADGQAHSQLAQQRAQARLNRPGTTNAQSASQ